MMQTIFGLSLFLTGICCFLLSCLASPPTAPKNLTRSLQGELIGPGAIPLRVVPDVPLWMTAKMPAGGITKYCGEITVGSLYHATIRLHFYEWPPYHARFRTGHCQLAVWVRKHPNDTFHLLTTIGPNKVTTEEEARMSMLSQNIDSAWGLNFLHAEFYWLDPATRRIPVIQASYYGQGEGNSRGLGQVLAFKNGFGRPPIAQGFESFSNHSDGLEWQFGSFDVRGWHRIEGYYYPPESNSREVTHWDWNGSVFAPKEH